MNKRNLGALLCLTILLTASLFLEQTGANALGTARQTFMTIELQRVVSGLADPIYLTNAKDGTNRLFIVERAGIIKVLRPGSSVPSVFLNITTRVLSSGSEQGLLGLAFHPQYPVNRRFFVNYTRQSDGATVIAEYRASATNPNIASTAEIPLLVIPQPFANHNGGMIEFGRDGFLYIGMGDGGAGNDPGNRAQNLEELLGKMLRIDVDHANGAVPYSSPSSNPFFGPTAGRDEIYAFGFRNPWRFSFDRGGTGQLYAGDVGQGAREEIDIVTRGGNYGWRIFEGTLCTGLGPTSCSAGGFTPPVAEYEHSGGRCSITGGYVYRGARSSLPTGAYVFSDFCTGEIIIFQNGSQTPLLNPNLNISSFGEDEAGEIYVVGLGGSVDRITASPAPAACTFSISPASQSFAANGGTGSFMVMTAGDCNWLAAANADWITITSGASGTGNGTVAFTVAANTGQSSRTGKINAAGQTFTITQAAQSATPALNSLRLSASVVAGCKSLTGTVTLATPAPAGGAVVQLSDNIAATRMPASVTVPAGATTKSFAIPTLPVTATQSGIVTASLGTVTKSATLKLRPIGVESLSLSPNPVTGPASVTGTVVLECPAPAGGIVVNLSSSNPAVATLAASSINIAAGTKSKTFAIRTADVPASRTALIRATANGITKSVVLTVN